MMRSKRGVIEVQFNWIFIIIVGAIIILFFVSVAQKQKSIHDTRIQNTVQADLTAIITGAELSTGTSHIINIPETTIEYSCEGYKTGNRRPFTSRFAFAPGSIETRQLLTWSYEWNAPYKITNFLMTTSPSVRYVIVWDGSYGDEALLLNETLPDEMRTEVIGNSDFDALDSKNNPKVRFVWIGTTPSTTVPVAFRDMQDEDVSLLHITPDTEFEYGKLEFFQKENNDFISQGTNSYVGEASMYGAVFTDDLETYNCSMQRALQQWGHVTYIYANRTDFLNDYISTVSPGSPCKTDYSHAFEDILIPTLEVYNDKYDSTAANTIYQSFDDLKTYNNNLILRSCPIIY